MSDDLRKVEPMNRLLLQWAKEHLRSFETMGISLEIIDHTKEIEEKKLRNPVQVVFFDGGERMGEIRIWMSGIADLEILNRKGENIYRKHYDEIKWEMFEDLFHDFFHNMVK